MLVALMLVTLAPEPFSVPTKLPDVVLPVTAKLVRVPTLVMLPWAAVVTVPAVVAAPVNVPTNVVDVTLLNPATVVTVVPNVSAVLPNVTAALAKRAWASVPELILVALMLVTLAPEPFNVPTKLPDVVLPVTANAVNVPTDVMLGCAAVVTVPAVVAAPDTVMVYVPDRRAAGNVPMSMLEAFTDVSARPLPVTVVNAPVVPDTLPDVTLPVTAKLVSVPTDVMLACAAVVTVPAVVALVAAPLKVAVIVPAEKLPLASRATMVLTVLALVALLVRVIEPTVVLTLIPVPDVDSVVTPE
jgi:hypothetical protein